MTQFSYTVTHLDSSTDISNDIETIDVTDVGTGEINHATIRLNANLGKFITTAPVIDQFHKIRIVLTDDAANTYNRVYEVDRIVPIENAQEGKIVELELLGQESHLQRIHFAKQFYFADAFSVVRDIGDFYNANKTSLQPTLENTSSTTDNTLPDWTANAYEFNIAEKYCYDGMMEVVDRMGSSVVVGGGGDFWDLYFMNGSDQTKFKISAIRSGSLPTAGNEITITDTDAINPDPTEGGIEQTSGTHVLAWGADQFGSNPPEFQRFHGNLEAYYNAPFWESDKAYKIGAKIQYTHTDTTNRHYQRINSDVTVFPANNPQVDANWDQIDEQDAVGGASAEYSPWTNNRKTEWQLCGSNASTLLGSGFNGGGCWDSNLVIQDENRFRTWAHIRVTTDTINAPTGIPQEWTLVGGNDNFYRGTRVFVDTTLGAASGAFATTDKNGITFANRVAQYDGSQWVVINETKGRPIQNNDMIAVDDQGAVYERQGGAWVDIKSSDRANECYHTYSSVINTAGVNSTPKTAGGTFGDSSAVEYTYQYSTLDALSVFAPEYYRIGCWANIQFPFPINSFEGKIIGIKWGNGIDAEPATYDTNNMHLSRSGSVGFNSGEEEDLGPNSALSFDIKLRFEDNLQIPYYSANFKMRCAMYDTEDNVVTQDFIISMNNNLEQIVLPIANFEIYRARLPIRLGNTLPNWFLKKLDILNVFQYKNIKKVCIFCTDSYDSQGRYDPTLSRFITEATQLVTNSVILTIDSFRWVKPLLASSGVITATRNLETRFMQLPFITNYQQLKQAVLAQLEIEQFRHKQFEVRTEGKFNISYGNTFFLNKAGVVSDSDTRTADSGGTASTIRLVAKKIIYRVIKGDAENAHFTRIITGIKRFVG